MVTTERRTRATGTDMSEDNDYESGSLSLWSTVAMGTGVMIGAGIFALTGQVAELAGPLFPLAFVAAAAISGFSAYSYIKVSSEYPSAGGIAMILKKAYGPTMVTGAAALMMALSMVINESLVARTFATYALRPFGLQGDSLLVPGIALAVVAVSLTINLAGNEAVGRVAQLTAVLKIGGIVLFALVGIWASGLTFEAASGGWVEDTDLGGFLAGTALGILAFKGFTTITNSGAEVEKPEKNVGRAIALSLLVCLAVYVLVTLAVGGALDIGQIVAAKDYALAEAARPALGEIGVWATVAIALIATGSGILASMFAVSRMLAMLTKMELIPHSHFGLPGRVQHHTLVYVAVVAAALAAFMDLGRIASMGAFLYLVMDMVIHWGVLRHLREDVGARAPVVVIALALDGIVLVALAVLKAFSDPLILAVSAGTVVVVAIFVGVFLRSASPDTSEG